MSEKITIDRTFSNGDLRGSREKKEACRALANVIGFTDDITLRFYLTPIRVELIVC